MKKILLIALLLISVKGFAQVTLEHSYPFTVYLNQTSSNEWDYITTAISQKSQNDTINIYSIDHSFIESFILPCPPDKRIFDVLELSKNLFSTAGKFDVVYHTADTGYNYTGLAVTVLEDDGTTLLKVQNAAFDEVMNTSSGTKLLITSANDPDSTMIYSLPGSAAGIPRPQGGGSVNNAYPNPATDAIHLPYNLNGSEQGELVVTNMNGQLLKQYKVTNAFSDILLNASELPKGSYLYYLVTNGNHSEAKQFVVQ